MTDTCKLAIIGVAGIALGGCLTVHTHSADEFLGGYTRGEEFVTNVPLILMWESSGGHRRILAVPPDAGVPIGGRLYSAPPASNPWGPCREQGACWVMGDVIAVVPARSHLTFSRIEYSRGVDLWYGTHSDVTPFCNLELGSDAPVEVDISDLSRFSERFVKGKRMLVPEPDPEIISRPSNLDVGP